jgi:hypothetical protein
MQSNRGALRLPIPLDVAHYSGVMWPRGDEASSGSDTVPPFGFAKGARMPTERLVMRHVRDVMTLKSAGTSSREIVRLVGALDSAADDPTRRDASCQRH